MDDQRVSAFESLTMVAKWTKFPQNRIQDVSVSPGGPGSRPLRQMIRELLAAVSESDGALQQNDRWTG